MCLSSPTGSVAEQRARQTTATTTLELEASLAERGIDLGGLPEVSFFDTTEADWLAQPVVVVEIQDGVVRQLWLAER